VLITHPYHIIIQKLKTESSKTAKNVLKVVKLGYNSRHMIQEVSGISQKNWRKRVGLALSGGSARGLAHLGVVSVLEEQRIPIDLVAGASFGSIVGSLYACGYSAGQILSKAKEFFAFTKKRRFDRENLWDLAQDAFRRELGDIRIEDTRIPLSILSLDITEEKARVFSSGPMFTAIRASSAFPGLFDPLLYEGHMYIDGGILNSMLLKIAHDMGAEIILFSEVSFLGVVYRKKWVNSLLNAVLRIVPAHKAEKFRNPDRMSDLKLIPRILAVVKRYKKDCELYRSNLADIIIEPELEGIRPMDFEKFDVAFQRGREAALRQIDPVRRLLEPVSR
jgi:NTE family protein